MHAMHALSQDMPSWDLRKLMYPDVSGCIMNLLPVAFTQEIQPSVSGASLDSSGWQFNVQVSWDITDVTLMCVWCVGKKSSELCIVMFCASQKRKASVVPFLESSGQFVEVLRETTLMTPNCQRSSRLRKNWLGWTEARPTVGTRRNFPCDPQMWRFPCPKLRMSPQELKLRTDHMEKGRNKAESQDATTVLAQLCMWNRKKIAMWSLLLPSVEI